MTALIPLLAETGSQTWADLVSAAVVLLFAWLGSRFGLYMAIVWGLQALASVVAAFALLDWTDGMLVWAGMTNEFGEIWRQTIAFVTALTVVAIAIRLWIGASIPEDATSNYPPLVDLVGGAAVGIVDGLVAVGILQVALQMAPLPERWAFDPAKSALDLGRGMIELVGQCAGGMAPEDREIMLDGEPGFRPDKLDAAPVAAAAVVDPSAPPVEKIELPQWSEVFADVNWNQMYDKGEKYLDADGDGQFTWILKSNDRNTSKSRDIGLRERYKLGPWVTVRTLDKQLVQRAQRNGKLGAIVGIPWPPPGGFAPGVTAPPAGDGAAAPAGNAPPGVPSADPAATAPPPGDDPGRGVAAPAAAPPGDAAEPPAAPPRPAQGNPPGVPKRPRQPAAATPPPTPVPPPAPPEGDTPEPAPPEPEQKPEEKPEEKPAGKPDDPPPAPPGPPSPFKPKK